MYSESGLLSGVCVECLFVCLSAEPGGKPQQVPGRRLPRYVSLFVLEAFGSSVALGDGRLGRGASRVDPS